MVPRNYFLGQPSIFFYVYIFNEIIWCWIWTLWISLNIIRHIYFYLYNWLLPRTNCISRRLCHSNVTLGSMVGYVRRLLLVPITAVSCWHFLKLSLSIMQIYRLDDSLFCRPMYLREINITWKCDGSPRVGSEIGTSWLIWWWTLVTTVSHMPNFQLFIFVGD